MCTIWNNIIFLALLFLCACNGVPDDVRQVLSDAGKNRNELEKVIQHYKNSGDNEKLRATYFLIGNLKDQFHHSGNGVEIYRKRFNTMDSLISSKKIIDYGLTWDSLQPQENSHMKKVRDMDVIKADFLINNIDNAFIAWQYPWARDLSFEEFCNYILPYKLRNEAPENWREHFMKKYNWVLDSVKNKTNSLEACVLINEEMKRWFYITKLSCPFDLSFSDINKLRSGRCSESTQLTAYAMRAMGIPVTLDYVPMWANRNSGHDWNGLIMHGKTIPFLGTEVNPGEYKLEFPMPGSLKSKKPKVFRRTFVNRENSPTETTKDLENIPGSLHDVRWQDVTKEYVPVADVTLKTDSSAAGFSTAYLCVFNNLRWNPAYWGSIRDNRSVTFADMGTEIVYLPVLYAEGDLIPFSPPFVLQKDGSLRFVDPNESTKIEITLDRKYPVDEDNEIFPDQNYELFYWKDAWISLGKQTASGKTLTFKNVPAGALLWLRNLDKGMQERIFTIENGQPVWW